MIPLPVIIAEFVMALGGAFLVANLWALLRPRIKRDAPAPPQPGRLVLNAIIGFLVFAWGFASFVTQLNS